MNCCDDNGNCNQGRDCPARRNRVKPYPNVVKDLPIQLVDIDPLITKGDIAAVILAITVLGLLMAVMFNA